MRDDPLSFDTADQASLMHDACQRNHANMTPIWLIVTPHQLMRDSASNDRRCLPGIMLSSRGITALCTIVLWCAHGVGGIACRVHGSQTVLLAKRITIKH